MGKKIIRLTEGQLVRVVKSIVKEQIDISNDETWITAIQKFLNWKNGNKNLKEDGVKGEQTTEAIKVYQRELARNNSIPNKNKFIDGIFGMETVQQMPEEHQKKLYKYIASQGDIFQVVHSWFL